MLRDAEACNAHEASLVAMAPDGLVRALVGGADFDASQFDRSTMARRPPGSTFKPFIYLRALETGHLMSETVLDAPFTQAESRTLGVRPGWPANFERYYASVSLRQAFAQSLNAATVRLAHGVGLAETIATARRVGLNVALPAAADPLPLALALGAGMTVVPIDMTAAYAPFFNGGYRATPHGVMIVLATDGRIVSRRSTQPGPRVMSPASAGAMSDLLHEVVVSGTGRRANDGFWAGGKTGTTQNDQDAWFIGFDRHDGLLTSIWVGNDDNAPMRDISGGTLPADAWRRFNRGIGGAGGEAVMARK
jgi:penicillin-binding protein 1A